MKKEIKCAIIEVNEKEKNLIELLREVEFGEVIIFMVDGKPYRIEKLKESIML